MGCESAFVGWSRCHNSNAAGRPKKEKTFDSIGSEDRIEVTAKDWENSIAVSLGGSSLGGNQFEFSIITHSE